MENEKNYQLIVVGAGHGGCEAAHIGAKLGLKTLLVTLSLESIGLMPCNPSLGGPAKGHLIFELDALGGLMGKIGDRTTIQKRMLNLGKGPAVQALRSQVDRFAYTREMIKELEATPNLSILQGEVKDILTDNSQVVGCTLTTGLVLKSSKIILATGTYLDSKVIIGEYEESIGPNSLSNSKFLGKNLQGLGFNTMRFKTGTPPRLDKRTLDFSELSLQEGNEERYTFSFSSPEKSPLPSVPCYLTHSNKDTQEIILENIHLSPLYSGKIEGVGPRYCPSIEDKIMRFPDKTSHHLFIEPEGLAVEEMYLQGFSTSLPVRVQEKMVHSLPGLENAHIMKYGYAIEYDVIDASELTLTLESKNIKGLFFAGQINGTSGYEEAAAQGLLAGINAALSFKEQEPLILKRSESYIGVLLDDLITKGTKEPYRMFTACAEYRLLLRQSSADRRLTPLAYKLGLIEEDVYQRFLEKMSKIDQEVERIKELTVPLNHPGIKELLAEKGSAPLKEGVKFTLLLKRPELSYNDLSQFFPSPTPLSFREKEEVELLIKYEGYIKKQISQVLSFNKGEKKQIPMDLVDYGLVKGLTGEAIEKLNLVKPISIGQASRISGITPADITVLLVYLEQRKRLLKEQADD